MTYENSSGRLIRALLSHGRLHRLVSYRTLHLKLQTYDRTRTSGVREIPMQFTKGDQAVRSDGERYCTAKWIRFRWEPEKRRKKSQNSPEKGCAMIRCGCEEGNSSVITYTRRRKLEKRSTKPALKFKAHRHRLHSSKVLELFTKKWYWWMASMHSSKTSWLHSTEPYRWRASESISWISRLRKKVFT